MSAPSDNETWIIDVGDEVIQRKAEVGMAALSPRERLIYCLWVADYGMRNAGNLETASDLYEPFREEAADFSKQLSLNFTYESFSLPRAYLQADYFKRFDQICEEIKAIPA